MLPPNNSNPCGKPKNPKDISQNAIFACKVGTSSSFEA
jgi:hypothetical protein